MKYIRTKDKVYEVTNDKYGVFEENGVFKIHCENMGHHWDSELDVIAQADTIEELFMPNDLLVVGDDKNQMPIFIESIEYLKCWLHNHDIYKIKEFYIKNGDDFKCVAKANKEGVLCLI